MTRQLNVSRVRWELWTVRLATMVCVVLLSVPAFADMIINPTFTANFNADFGANAAAAQAAWIAAANVFTTNFYDNITVNITVDAVTGTSVLGQSNIWVTRILDSYGNLRSAVVADATSADDRTATGAGGSLGVTDPTGGVGTWWVSTAEAKALGIIPNDLVNDGTITFGTGFSYTFSGPIVPGTFDFQGVAAHEISEVLGRIGFGGETLDGIPNSYTLLDAFSFSRPGARVLGNGGRPGAEGSFSIDNGTTMLKMYDDQFVNHQDFRDWASGTNDAFNQFSDPGVSNPVSALDLRVMDVIGYDPVPVPEPSSFILVISGLAAGAFIRRRRKT